MVPAPFKLDLNETFPRLANAPIVEAAIHWQARSQSTMEPEPLRAALTAKLPEYPKCEPIQQIEFMAMVSGPESTPVVRHQKDWTGFRLTSEDGHDIVQFKRDGVIFSRTKPYDHWGPFSTAAKKAWQVFRELAEPMEIQRLGVRFINQLAAATSETLERYLSEPPTCPSDLPLKEFVYQSTFDVPEHAFGVRVVKLMQPSLPGLPETSGLFIDCDVFTTRPLDNDQRMEEALTEMRWLKNKFFFSLLTQPAIQSFQ